MSQETSEEPQYFRCMFHMAVCPGGCAERHWCWQEGDPEEGLSPEVD